MKAKERMKYFFSTDRIKVKSYCNSSTHNKVADDSRESVKSNFLILNLKKTIILENYIALNKNLHELRSKTEKHRRIKSLLN